MTGVQTCALPIYRELNTQPVLTANVPQAKSGLAEPLKQVFKELKLPVADKLVSNGWAQVSGDSVLAEIDEKQVNSEGVPDVVGMGLRDAILLLESNGFQIKAVGRGSVQHQSVRPGEKVKKGTEIVLQLG